MEHCNVTIGHRDGSVLNCDVIMGIAISQSSTVMSKCNTVIKAEHCGVTIHCDKTMQHCNNTTDHCDITMDHFGVMMWQCGDINELWHIIMLGCKMGSECECSESEWSVMNLIKTHTL